MVYLKWKVLILTAVILLIASSTQAMDCPGGWQVLPKHYRGAGSPCQALGLDSHRGVCQPGHSYETLCDDTSKHRFKTCQGPRLCSGYGHVPVPPPPPVPQNNCTTWDYIANMPCPPGYVNPDCQGGCESAGEQHSNNCTSWDYQHNRPCPPGFINRDCKGNCGPI